MTSAALPQPFGKYTLVERIAAGGMAEVFKAKIFGVAGFEKTVAVKRILPHFAEDEGFVDMFVREANIAVRLSHSNIVQVFELGRVGSAYFIALEYVEGRDLKSVVRQAGLRKRALPASVAAFICQKVCAGLHHAHQATDDGGASLGIVHRDVSPHNVLVSWGGEVKVADFGIAKLQSRSRNTRTGMIKGKLAYMSPEQSKGDPDLDARSDVFAAGIVLFELLTGTRPFEGESDLEILRRIRESPVAAPSSIVPGIPTELDAVVARALAKDRAERFPDAGMMARALSTYLQRAGAADGRIVDESDVSELLRELLGGRTPSPSGANRPAPLPPEGKGGGTPILPASDVEVSTNAPTSGPGNGGLADTVVFAAAADTGSSRTPPVELARRTPAPVAPESLGAVIAAANTDGTATAPSTRPPALTRRIARNRPLAFFAVAAAGVAGLASAYGAYLLAGGAPAPAVALVEPTTALPRPAESVVAATTAPASAAPSASPARTSAVARVAVAAPVRPPPASPRGASTATVRATPAPVPASQGPGEIRVEGPKSYTIRLGGRITTDRKLTGMEPGSYDLQISDGTKTVTVRVVVLGGRATEVRLPDPLRDGLEFRESKVLPP